ncbi:hypothetical protein GUJ93_ZPchr0006g43672 [Zizania palustris]|uniref:Uncharacterized protein n=1 Tax=Zizania palustris TaxID=103762 RepID=A0A8J5SGT1_ZIZPA|nr:hypothetical protein GUJ93_ZPchr0006g43672 [Zizania palustris]
MELTCWSFLTLHLLHGQLAAGRRRSTDEARTAAGMRCWIWLRRGWAPSCIFGSTGFIRFLISYTAFPIILSFLHNNTAFQRKNMWMLQLYYSMFALADDPKTYMRFMGWHIGLVVGSVAVIVAQKGGLLANLRNLA